MLVNSLFRSALAALGAAAALAAASPALAAEAYPARQVTILVPFPAGGTTDIAARVVAAELGKAWNQPVVVENRAGAGGNVGTAEAARAAPDGYTLLMGTVSTTPSINRYTPSCPMTRWPTSRR